MALKDNPRFVHTAQTALEKADREYAYYKNGSPYLEGSVRNDTPQHHYLESQKSYREAKNYAEKALEVLKVVHGRNPETTKAVYDEIKQKSGSKNLDMFTANLSLMAEVKNFADRIKAKYDHIDVLVNNAGGQFGDTCEVTAEGHEKTFAINTLAP